MSNPDREKLRALCQELAARIQADPVFKALVINDPTGTLSARQLPAEAIPDFLQEVGMGSEVQAYCLHTCSVTGGVS